MQYKAIGKRVPGLGTVKKARGKEVYLSDLKFPSMLHGKILRSPYPHAKILKIDASEAERLPGVFSVITADDTPKIKFSFYPHLADQLPLAEKKVCYIGDPVAAVAAVDELTAEKAIELIKVEYEKLPAIFDPEEAIKPAAPRIHEQFQNNISFHLHREFGDVDRAFKEADFVFESEYKTSKPVHCCLETRVCIAYFDASEGSLAIWASTQCPHTLREEVSRVLKLPQNKVRIIKGTMGGGFGSRTVMDMNIPIAAILSQKTGKYVKIANTREEEFEIAKTRYPYIIKLKTGVKGSGQILAREAKILVDNGAYNDKGPATLYLSTHVFSVLYAVPNIKTDAYIVVTNKQPGTAFRGFGNPQLNFAAESQMDEIAERLKIDPVELRLKNANSSEPHMTVSGAKIATCGLKECIQVIKSVKEIKVGNRKRQKGGTKRRGIGMAVFAHCGAGTRYYKFNSTNAFLKIGRDGTIFVVTPVADMGQGTKTAMAQIAAEELGVGIENISLVLDDTDIIPYDLGAFGSRETVICGNAVRDAAAKAREEVFQFAGEFLNTNPEYLKSENGVISAKDDPKKSISFSEVVERIFRRGKTISTVGHFVDTTLPTDDNLKKGTGTLFPSYTFGAHAVEVKVDVETGRIEILKVIGAYDIGKAINPTLVEGQVEGAIVQGLGFALSEDTVLENGKVVNSNFLDYKILRSADIPQIGTFIVETNDPFGPYGAKGIGEPALVPIAPAVANAIYDAIGVRIRHLPITAESVLQALRAEE